MMIVPVLVATGGTFAFSAWSGNATAIFNETTATFSFTQNVTFVTTNAYQTPVTVVGTNTLKNVTSTTPEQVLDPTISNTDSSAITEHANVSNLVPGAWVELMVTVKNTGSSTLNLSAVSYSWGQALVPESGNVPTQDNNKVTTNLSGAFITPLTTVQAVNWFKTLKGGIGIDFGALPGQSTDSQYLTAGQSYSYVVYLGAGPYAGTHQEGLEIQIFISSTV